MTYAMKMQEERKEGIREGREEMRQEMQKKTALKMLKNGKSLEEIAYYTELTKDDIRKLAQENGL